LAAAPTQLLTTLMTFVVGFVTLPTGKAGVVGASSRVASWVFAVGSAEVVASFVVCCSGSGSAGAYSYTTSFLGFSVGLSVEGSVVSSSFLVMSLPSWVWAESSSVSLRVKPASGSGWLSPAASADPVASSSCVAAPAAGATAGFARVPSARLASVRVVSASLVPSLITISSLVSV